MKIKQILILIWDEFVYGGHLQSLGAVSIVYVSAALLNVKISWDILFITYILFYPLYLYNRYKEIKIDYSTNPQRTEYLKIYISKAPVILFIVVSVLIGSLIYFTNFRAIVFTLTLLIFGLLYTITFKKITQKIPLFKNFYVAAFFTALAFFPIIFYSYPLTRTLVIGLLIFMAFVYGKALMMQILLDVKDKETDEKEKLRTLAVIIGKEKTFKVLTTLSVFTVVPLIFAVYFGVFPLYLLMLFFTIPFDFYCFKLAQDKKYFGYLLMSGKFVLWPILILIGKVLL